MQMHVDFRKKVKSIFICPWLQVFTKYFVCFKSIISLFMVHRLQINIFFAVLCHFFSNYF